MRMFSLAAVAAAVLVPAAPAFAGDPTMPLAQVQAGMKCTAYSVVQGTAISSFDVEVIDVAGGEAEDGVGNILVRVSGPAVDATGIGPGFSGSPIYCPDGQGVQRVIGAISEATGEYGGKIALATSIDRILATPVDAATQPTSKRTARKTAASSRARTSASGAAASSTRTGRGGASARGGSTAGGGGPRAGSAAVGRGVSARMKAAQDAARPLAAPLSISGLSTPLANALTAAAAKQGRPVLAAPAGPLGSFAPQTLRPGSAVAVGYSNGDVRTSSIGTVSYVDGDRVWVFGHQLEGAGRRALLLQDAYVFTVINSPLQIGSLTGTYKLAASGHDLGTVTNDGFDAVTGRTGVLPHTVPVTVLARDEASGRTQTVRTSVADEAAVDLPSGGSWTSFIAPLAVSQAAQSLLGSIPGRLTGDMCARITLKELKRPLRFCNRYVSTSTTQTDDGSSSNAVMSGATGDLSSALAAIDAYTGKPPRVTGVEVLLKLRRGADQAFIRKVSVPRSVRPGERIRARVTLQRLRGGRLVRSYTLRIPPDARPGRQTLRLTGKDVDQSDDAFTTIILGDDDGESDGGDPGPGNLAQLAEAVRATGRSDGVTLRLGGARGDAFHDAAFRISGRAEVDVRVVRR